MYSLIVESFLYIKFTYYGTLLFFAEIIDNVHVEANEKHAHCYYLEYTSNEY